MAEDQKADSGGRFLPVWSDQGFGTLGQRDTELLLFSRLIETVGEGVPRTDYEWARALRSTSAKVRNLRRDACMRFGKLLDNDPRAALLRGCLLNVSELQVQTGSGNDVMICVIADDPVIELELEPRLRRLGGYFDYVAESRDS